MHGHCSLLTATELGPDDFHFSSMNATEDITRYVLGGYHPVIIGDILRSPASSSSYRVMHKLGFGSYATVWLAQKTDASRAFFAIKITIADGLSNRETECLRAVLRECSSNIVTLADAFELHGPNGVHSVLVTDIVAPILSLLSSERSPHWRKKVAYDLTNAIAQLHASGVVHGDLHLGNVGISMPQLSTQDPEDVMQDLDWPELTLVLPTDHRSASPSLPAYVVAPCNMAAYYNKIIAGQGKHEPHAKIFDFGNAHRAGTQPTSFQCAIEACAPESVFARVVEQNENPPIEVPADVWALGAMIYEIFYGSSLFRGVGIRGVMSHMVSLAGAVPSQWEAHLLSAPPPDADAWWGSRRDRLRKACIDDQDTEALIGLLRKVLVLDPSFRPSAKVICRDIWFQKYRKIT
ncbi:kinase-like protein [Mycena pura]|uniref:Kinase-like protein n=1 Tax=Mycena pura TaxID=153505 RepID=A0AAD6Y4T2_9AGAR|nr:kinase-like protein [Mycena pura]